MGERDEMIPLPCLLIQQASIRSHPPSHQALCKEVNLSLNAGKEKQSPQQSSHASSTSDAPLAHPQGIPPRTQVGAQG